MDIPYRVYVAAGIVLLAVSCSTTKVVTLPALDASVTTEAEALVVYTDTDYERGYKVRFEVARGAGEGAAQEMENYLRATLQSGDALFLGILLAPIMLPIAATSGANRAHSEDEVDAAARAFNLVAQDKELLASIDRRFVEALDTDTTKQWSCIEATSVATGEPCSGETLTAHLELRPIFVLAAVGKINPDIIIYANVAARATMGHIQSGSESVVVVYAEWMYREKLGNYFELAKDNAVLLRGNKERILDRFAEKIAEDLYLAPRATIIVSKRDDRITGTTVLEVPEGKVAIITHINGGTGQLDSFVRPSILLSGKTLIALDEDLTATDDTLSGSLDYEIAGYFLDAPEEE